MKRIMLRKPFDIDIENAAGPVPDREQVLVRTRATSIAAGTEMALYLGTNHDLACGAGSLSGSTRCTRVTRPWTRNWTSWRQVRPDPQESHHPTSSGERDYGTSDW